VQVTRGLPRAALFFAYADCRCHSHLSVTGPTMGLPPSGKARQHEHDDDDVS